MHDLTSKTILVSGGAAGIGAAIAKSIAAAGGKVVIGDVRSDLGERLAGELGTSARSVSLDVTKEAEWQDAIAATADFGGAIDGLVNNAGIYMPRELADTDLALFERHVLVNQTGCFLGMKHGADAMSRGGSGAIVNISSTAGLKGSLAFAYSATKWAVRGMTKSAALSLAGSGIRVNSVHPGLIGTDLLNVRTEDEIVALEARVPMRRRAEAGEVAHVVAFLLSDAASYITGAEIAVDGGSTA